MCLRLRLVVQLLNKLNPLATDLKNGVFILSLPELREFAKKQIDQRLCIDTTFNVCDNENVCVTCVLMQSTTTQKFFAPYIGRNVV